MGRALARTTSEWDEGVWMPLRVLLGGFVEAFGPELVGVGSPEILATVNMEKRHDNLRASGHFIATELHIKRCSSW
jgi:hypothetical protein